MPQGQLGPGAGHPEACRQASPSDTPMQTGLPGGQIGRDQCFLSGPVQLCPASRGWRSRKGSSSAGRPGARLRLRG